VSAPGPAVGRLERVEALFRNPALYALAELVPGPDPTIGGRPRHYPVFMALAFDALLSVFGSARQTEAELSHPLIWELIRRTVAEVHPDRDDLWLPERPMRRHHHRYTRDAYLTRPDIWEAIAALHRQLAVDQAESIGLLRADGPGSWTHPDLSRMMYADGKVITPLFKATATTRRLEKSTGELLPVRHEPDAHLHFQGDGEQAFGTKFVIVAARTHDHHGRIIIDTNWVPTPGGEAATAMDCFERLAPIAAGTQGVLYDTALRGVHHQTLMRDLGWLSVNRVTAKAAPANRSKGPRAGRSPKSTYLEDKTVDTPNGPTAVSLYAQGGALGIGELDDRGNVTFTELERRRTHRNADKNGRYRWYNDYALPERFGAGTLTVRLHATPADTARKLNRTENLRPIAPSDPDFKRLYSRRNDAESINRGLDDSLYLRRAHTVGHARQHLNLLGYALVVNAIAVQRHRQRGAPIPLAA
jgi:hypothetical protein